MSRRRQILTFLGIFALILAATHFYMFERIDYYLQLSTAGRVLAASLLGGFSLLTLTSLPLSRVLPHRVASVLSWIVFPWMGIALLMFVTFLTTDFLWIVFYYISGAISASTQHDFGIAALTLTALISLYASFKGLSLVRIKRIFVKLKRLPASFDGFRIVQITDLHIGPLIHGAWVRKIVDRVNALNPDLIVITGDLVDGSVGELGGHAAPLADLRARHGVYFVTGNHEYYSGVTEWCRHISQMGIRVLRNERVSIMRETADDSIDLAGVDDWASSHFRGQGPDLPKALAERDTSKPVILLAHQPAAVEEASQFGVDLQLSGHTHGGQIWPFTYLVYLQQPFAQGLHRYGDTETQIYISPGTGFWGPPMRLGTVAEITEITLRN